MSPPRSVVGEPSKDKDKFTIVGRSIILEYYVHFRATTLSNRPFPSYLLPLFQKASSCKIINMKMLFDYKFISCKSNSFSHERFYTKTRFVTEVKSNSEIAYLFVEKTGNIPVVVSTERLLMFCCKSVIQIGLLAHNQRIRHRISCVSNPVIPVYSISVSV